MSSRIAFVVLLLFVVASATLASEKVQKRRIDAAHSVALDAVILDGVIQTDGENTATFMDDIKEQLFYLVGPLNAFHSGADTAHTQITIKKVTPIPNSEYQEVRYDAVLLVAWANNTQNPLNMTVPLPLRVNDQDKKAFFNRYGRTCSTNSNEEDLKWHSFYYYYRPGNGSCELNRGPSDLAVPIRFAFQPSGKVTVGKAPEYEKVWEDHQLVATLIFGKNDKETMSDTDAGVWGYNTTSLQLRQTYGNPIFMSVPLAPGEVPHANRPDHEMSFDLGNGRVLNVALFLVEKMGLLHPTPEFKKRYEERTRNSDFISYNGHSGFGDNIRALAKMGNFVKGQYQLFYVNGCDTFAYVEDSLMEAHRKVNPGSSPYKYFDIITNAMPSSFSGIPVSNMAIINALVGQQLTYHDILSQFEWFQRAVVTGEEDNRWPLPFNE